MAVDRAEETHASHEAGTTREQLLVESCGVSRARTPFRNPAAVFLTANRNTSSSSSSPPQPELVCNTSRSSGTAMSNLCSIKNSPWRKGTSERGRNLLLATSLCTLLEVFPIDNSFSSGFEGFSLKDVKGTTVFHAIFYFARSLDSYN